VIEKYRNWLISNKELYAQIEELRGKHLVCWCAPKSCHADVLLTIANAPKVIPHHVCELCGEELNDDNYAEKHWNYESDDNYVLGHLCCGSAND
jgi:hypothetical protein